MTIRNNTRLTENLTFFASAGVIMLFFCFLTLVFQQRELGGEIEKQHDMTREQVDKARDQAVRNEELIKQVKELVEKERLDRRP